MFELLKQSVITHYGSFMAISVFLFGVELELHMRICSVLVVFLW